MANKPPHDGPAGLPPSAVPPPQPAESTIVPKKQAQDERIRPSAPPALEKFQWHEFASFAKTLTLFVCAALLIRVMVVEAFKIPSGSMLPTLQIGDHLLVSKLSYGLRLPFFTNMAYRFADPQRNDIVVFTRPPQRDMRPEDEGLNIIKRVIGLPGDRVHVKGTTVYINDRPLVEPFARWDENGMNAPEFGPEIVPPGHVFMMGDNRDHSKDSRFWESPWLPIERIKGRALFIYWSWDDLSRIGNIIR